MLTELKNQTNFTYTQNGAIAKLTTNSAIVDFFSTAGVMRHSTANEKIQLFSRSFSEDALITLKMLFYFRDVQKGQGERQLFRDILKHLATTKSGIVVRNIELIPYFGRWDDIYELFNTPCEKQALELIKKQLYTDIKNDKVSLLAKWLKSENASNKETIKIAQKIREYLKLSPRSYRQVLSALRKKIDIVETKLTNKDYVNIDYSKVPSCAGKRYIKAFLKNDNERYTDFIQSVIKGENKINAGVLYPYDIVKQIINDTYLHPREEMALDAMWRNLPNYVDDSSNTLAVIDTSGSMTCEGAMPLSIAISLGIYFAERNKGEFMNYFISFSHNPRLIKIEGDDIASKVRWIMQHEEIADTNIEKVFDLLLNIAVKRNLQQSELPSRIIIISDMQFNDAVAGESDTCTLFQYITKKWNAKGYIIPNLIFWNASSEGETFPMTVDDAGVQFVSGASPSLFQSILKNEFVSPLQVVYDTVNVERYSKVTL